MIYPSKEAAKMSDCNRNSSILDNNYSGNIEGCSKEWLNLRLGRTEDLVAADQGFLLNSTCKIFSCNFCKRKFYSSQALGGHQNAHRRERGALRRYQSEKLMAMVDLPVNKPVIQSLGVQLHSLVHKPSMDSKPKVARLKDVNMGNGLPWLPKDIRFNWPGSFHMASEFPMQQSESLKVDLNLRL
ncbi:hypothetical protein Dsin_003163 [Dipteronia sinensis]|uniref:C2H2-type domain-containing protein n=1 Tax=Dipteronia sinensis TaxID=43782 RepID=A0AAE0B8L2_9ROSI|nr:hypothetical protein Dsin_003163 [Dipteronia sinensis]